MEYKTLKNYLLDSHKISLAFVKGNRDLHYKCYEITKDIDEEDAISHLNRASDWQEEVNKYENYIKELEEA